MPPQDVQTSLVSGVSFNPRFDFTNGTKINIIKLMNTTVHTHSSLTGAAAVSLFFFLNHTLASYLLISSFQRGLLLL